MDFLGFLERLRTPVGDAIMSAVTRLGEETFFLAVVLVIYWCVSKKEGYRMLVASYVAIVCNQFLKLVFRVPRPWVRDPSLTTVPSAMEEATGYSFPSGHTTNITAMAGTIYLDVHNRRLRLLCVIIVALVAFSRMYLGVHTPADVFTAMAVTVLSTYLIHRLFNVVERHANMMYVVLGVICLLAAIYLLFAGLWPFPEDIDPVNLESGRENACTMLGATLGFALGYFLDRRYINFSEKASLGAQFLKVALGLVAIIALKQLLKAPFEAAFGQYVGYAARYFIIAVFAAAVWPMTFKFFSRLGRKAKES